MSNRVLTNARVFIPKFKKYNSLVEQIVNMSTPDDVDIAAPSVMSLSMKIDLDFARKNPSLGAVLKGSEFLKVSKEKTRSSNISIVGDAGDGVTIDNFSYSIVTEKFERRDPQSVDAAMRMVSTRIPKNSSLARIFVNTLPDILSARSLNSAPGAAAVKDTIRYLFRNIVETKVGSHGTMAVGRYPDDYKDKAKAGKYFLYMNPRFVFNAAAESLISVEDALIYILAHESLHIRLGHLDPDSYATSRISVGNMQLNNLLYDSIINTKVSSWLGVSGPIDHGIWTNDPYIYKIYFRDVDGKLEISTKPSPGSAIRVISIPGADSIVNAHNNTFRFLLTALALIIKEYVKDFAKPKNQQSGNKQGNQSGQQQGGSGSSGQQGQEGQEGQQGDGQQDGQSGGQGSQQGSPQDDSQGESGTSGGSASEARGKQGDSNVDLSDVFGDEEPDVNTGKTGTFDDHSGFGDEGEADSQSSSKDAGDEEKKSDDASSGGGSDDVPDYSDNVDSSEVNPDAVEEDVIDSEDIDDIRKRVEQAAADAAEAPESGDDYIQKEADKKTIEKSNSRKAQTKAWAQGGLYSPDEIDRVVVPAPDSLNLPSSGVGSDEVDEKLANRDLVLKRIIDIMVPYYMTDYVRVRKSDVPSRKVSGLWGASQTKKGLNEDAIIVMVDVSASMNLEFAAYNLARAINQAIKLSHSLKYAWFIFHSNRISYKRYDIKKLRNWKTIHKLLLNAQDVVGGGNGSEPILGHFLKLVARKITKKGRIKFAFWFTDLQYEIRNDPKAWSVAPMLIVDPSGTWGLAGNNPTATILAKYRTTWYRATTSSGGGKIKFIGKMLRSKDPSIAAKLRRFM